MITQPFCEISKKMLKRKKTLVLIIKPTKCEILFHGDITEKRRSTVLASFQKLCPSDQNTKDELSILELPLGSKSQADILEEKIIEVDKTQWNC